MFFRFEGAGLQNADEAAVRAIDAKDAYSRSRDAEVEKPGLDTEPCRVGQKANGKGVFKRLLDFTLSQRTIHFKWRVVPVKLHSEAGCLSNANAMLLQCIYAQSFLPVNRLII